MAKQIKVGLHWVCLAALGPFVASLLAFLSFHFGSPRLGYFVGILLSIVSFIGAGYIVGSKKDVDGLAFNHAAWAITCIAIFVESHVPILIVLFFQLIVTITFGIFGIITVYDKVIKISKNKKTEGDRKRQASIDRIINLVGDAPQAQALLSAIKSLTPYVKEEEGRILGALSRASERYVMLRSLQETSTNEILRIQSRKEADEIALTARTLCSDATEMALKLLREFQTAEAEKILGYGNHHGSEFAFASEDFKKYLRGLQEITQHLGPGADEKLRQDIDGLTPQAEVKKFPMEVKSRLHSRG